MNTKISMGGHGRDKKLGQVSPEEGLQPLHSVRQGQGDVTSPAAVKVPRAQGQAVLVQVLAKLYLDYARGMVADHVLEVLEPATEDHQPGHGQERHVQAGEGRPFVDDFDDDDPGHGQPGHAGHHSQQPHQGRQQDSQPHSPGQCDEPGIKVHG